MKTEIVESDVLVIGGGLAGLRASLAARQAGASVCLVLKGRLGDSGNSPLAGGGFAAALRLADPGDSPESHLADTMAGGAQVNDAALVKAMVEQAPAAVLELHQMGVVFNRSGDNLAQYQLPVQSHPRAVRATGGMRQAMRLLAEVARREGVRVVEGVTISDLLTRDDRTLGAIGCSGEGDGPVAFQARATVLACGGVGQMYPLTSNHPEVTGDGYALAYRAGCRLADMEFLQFTPTALAWPPQMRGVSAGGALLGQEGARLLNRLGERFMQRYDPERMESTTRAVASRAMYREVVEGRGSEHGGVYLDVSEMDPALLEGISGSLVRQLVALGVDPTKERIELAPAVHHFMGGVKIDTLCRTGVPGIFAAGEVAAGVHGANRLNSNGLSEALVFGAVAGREAATYAAGGPPVPFSASDLEQASSEMQSLLGPGGAAEPLIERLRTIMLAGAGVERSETGILAALSELDQLRKEADQVRAASTAGISRVIELRNMLQVGEIILRSALARTESRGAHYRADYPERNDADWLANVVVARGPAGPVLQVVRTQIAM